MLLIARAEGNDNPLQLELVDLARESQKIIEYLTLVAEERGISVAVAGGGSVNADRILVQRAITNLVSNAIRIQQTIPI